MFKLEYDELLLLLLLLLVSYGLTIGIGGGKAAVVLDCLLLLLGELISDGVILGVGYINSISFLFNGDGCDDDCINRLDGWEGGGKRVLGVYCCCWGNGNGVVDVDNGGGWGVYCWCCCCCGNAVVAVVDVVVDVDDSGVGGGGCDSEYAGVDGIDDGILIIAVVGGGGGVLVYDEVVDIATVDNEEEGDTLGVSIIGIIISGGYILLLLSLLLFPLVLAVFVFVLSVLIISLSFLPISCTDGILLDEIVVVVEQTDLSFE